MRPAPTCSRTAGSRSTPITSRPRSANESASGRPTRPRPTTATFIGSRLARAAAPLGKVLPGERGHEPGVRREIAAHQPPRFLPGAVDPLEAALLHPARRHRDPAGVEVESGPDADHHRNVEAVAHSRHPLLLLRHADADPEHVRAGLVDLARHRGLLVLAERPERRRVAAHYAYARVAPAQGERQLHERALV